VAASAILLIAMTACRHPAATTAAPETTTLTIGFGLVAGADPAIGIQQVARSVAIEDLTIVASNGTTLAKLAEGWSASPDGLTVRVRLRAGCALLSSCGARGG